VSNPFYNYSGNFIPGTLARAEAEAFEFQAVQAGFAMLAVEGTDAGAANAYVVTTQGAVTGSYQDGNTVQFKPLAANTGTATLNVNAIGAVALKRYNGTNLQPGDIAANAWIVCQYNSTFGCWTLIAPNTAIGTFSGTISAAPPTNKVGLVAAGGVSTSVVPIDATYALDQSIAPTWTGQHTWNVGAIRAFTIQQGTATYGAAVTGTAGNAALIAFAGNGNVLGGGGADFYVGQDASGVAQIFQRGNANLVISTNATTRVTVAAAGNVTIAAPSSGTTLQLQSVTTAQSLIAGITSASNNPRLFVTHTEASGLTVLDFTGTANFNGALSIGGTQVIALSNSRNVTINAPSSGVALTINEVAATAAIAMTDGTTSGQIGAYGAALQIGTSSNHAVSFYSNNINRVQIANGGAVTISAPASGTALTINGTNAPLTVNFASNAAGFTNWLTASTQRGYIGVDGGGILGGGTGTGFGIRSEGDLLLLAGAGSYVMRYGASGNLTLSQPAAGQVALTVAACSGEGQPVAVFNQVKGINNVAGTYAIQMSASTDTAATYGFALDASGSSGLALYRTDSLRQLCFFGISGNLTIPTPSSGTTLVANVIAGNNGVTATDGTRTFAVQTSSTGSGSIWAGAYTNHQFILMTNNSANLVINPAGGAVAITGADISARGIALCRYKAATTSRASNITPSNDPDLTIALAAAGTYQFEGLLFIGNTTTGTQGFAFNVNYSGTFSSGQMEADGVINGAAASPLEGSVASGVAPKTFTYAQTVTGNVQDYLNIRGYVVATGAGTLAVSWSQNTTSANNTNMVLGSYFKVTQVS